MELGHGWSLYWQSRQVRRNCFAALCSFRERKFLPVRVLLKIAHLRVTVKTFRFSITFSRALFAEQRSKYSKATPWRLAFVRRLRLGRSFSNWFVIGIAHGNLNPPGMESVQSTLRRRHRCADHGRRYSVHKIYPADLFVAGWADLSRRLRYRMGRKWRHHQSTRKPSKANPNSDSSERKLFHRKQWIRSYRISENDLWWRQERT